MEHKAREELLVLPPPVIRLLEQALPLQEIEDIVDAIHASRRPVLYVGGGCLDCPAELRELVSRTGIPVAQTLMGLGAFPESDPLALQVLCSPIACALLLCLPAA